MLETAVVTVSVTARTNIAILLGFCYRPFFVDTLDIIVVATHTTSAPGLCPALSRAAVSDRANVKSWQYCDSDSWHDGEITVKCSVHSKNTS